MCVKRMQRRPGMSRGPTSSGRYKLLRIDPRLFRSLTTMIVLRTVLLIAFSSLVAAGGFHLRPYNAIPANAILQRFSTPTTAKGFLHVMMWPTSIDHQRSMK